MPRTKERTHSVKKKKPPSSQVVRDDGVTPVMANVLMVAVLVLVAIGVYLLLAEFEDASQSPDRRQGSFHVDLGPGSRTFHIMYVKGEEIPLAEGILQVVVDGVLTEHPLTDASTQMKAPDQWTVGEALCVVGPGDCLYGSASTVEVHLIVEGDVMFRAERELVT